MQVLNFDNGRITAEVHGDTGVVEIYVLNGRWQGKLDWDSMTIWPDAYPENRSTVNEWRVATRGEDKYY